MSLADQIGDLEEELQQEVAERSRLEKMLQRVENDYADLEYDFNELEAFASFVDKTNPELRIAFEAAKKLEGNK